MDAAATRSSAWLAELCRLVLNLRALALVLTTIYLPNADDKGLVLVAILVASATTFVVLRRWERLADRLERRPSLFAGDLLFGCAILLLVGPGSPFFFYTLGTAALAGLVYGPPGGALFAALLVGSYFYALSIHGGLDGADFQTTVGLPSLYVIAAASGAAIRRLAERQLALDAAIALREQEAAAERERARLARDMHDSLAKTVHGIALAAHALSRRVIRDPEGAVRDAELLAADAEVAAREARGLMHGLRDETAQMPLVEAMGEWVQAWATQTRHEARLDLEPGLELPDAARHEVLTVVKEALRNVDAHAHARRVDVALAHEGDDVVLVVRDDGEGFEAPPLLDDLGEQGHFGVLGMRERLALVGGTLDVRSVPRRGTTVRAAVPAVVVSTVRERVAG